MRIILRITFVCIVFLLSPLSLSATPQIPDTVNYNNEVFAWYGEGLAPLLQARNITFAAPHTACWDGHIAEWEIRDGKLLLVDLLAWIKGEGTDECQKKVGLEFLFEGTNAVFADWFSGEMVLLEYESKMDDDWIVDCTYWVLDIDSGIVIRSERKKETFDMHDNKQLNRYVSLFKKFPKR
jgi:hypothetical protein